MAYQLGNKSKAELAGVHPQLVRVVERAIVITTQDFGVHDGLRTEQEQAEYVRRGVSRTMNSMHRKQFDGFGHAVDVVPYINGQLRWEWGPIYHIASAMHKAALELDVEITWGGVWDRKFNGLVGDPVSLEMAVHEYANRYRRANPGREPLLDGPHYQLA